MIEAFARAGQKLFVAYYRRCLPRFVQVKHLLDSAALGRLTEVRYRYGAPRHLDPGGAWRVDATRAGGGLLLDLGSHALDLFDHLFGPLKKIVGTATTALRRWRSRSGRDELPDWRRDPGTAAWDFASERTKICWTSPHQTTHPAQPVRQRALRVEVESEA